MVTARSPALVVQQTLLVYAGTPQCKSVSFYEAWHWRLTCVNGLLHVLAETQMYESGDIIKYLFENYSDGQTKPPWGLMLGPLTAISCTLGMLPRVRLQPHPNAVSLGSWLHQSWAP